MGDRFRPNLEMWYESKLLEFRSAYI